MQTTKAHILVTGSHRSGTTWVGRTISQQPQIRYEHEPFNVDHPNRNFGLSIDTWYSHFESSTQKAEISRSFDKVFRSSRTSYALHMCNAAGIDAKTPWHFAKHLLLRNRQRILVKDPLALLSAGWLYETYRFQVICMIRNPLGFVASLKKAGWDFDFENLRRQEILMTNWLSTFADDIERMSREEARFDLVDRASLLWNVLHFVILKYRRTYPDWLFVKHEDIATNPQLEFENIFNFLDLEMNSTTRAYITRFTSQGNIIDATSTAYQPRDSKLLLRTWEDRLSDDEISRVQSATSKIASQFYGTNDSD